MASAFDGIERANVGDERVKQYFLPGRYRVQLDGVLIHRKRLGGSLFVVETTVLESDNPAILTGERRNWVQPMDADAAMPRIKCFVGAAHGYCPKRSLDALSAFVTRNVCDAAVSEDNPLEGVVLELECYNKKSQRTGKDFTIHMWTPLRENLVKSNKS